MAIHYSKQATAELSGYPSALADGAANNVKWKLYEVSLPADAAADELVYVTPELPAGVTVFPGLSYLFVSGDPGSGTLTVDIGIVSEDDLATVVDVSAGAKQSFDGNAPVATTATYNRVKAKLEVLTGDVGAITMYFVLCTAGLQ